jgi:hypothetical protein
MNRNNDDEVTELIRELEQLQLRITSVNDRLKLLKNNTEGNNQTETTKNKNILRVGDKIEVTNKYKGRLGVQGTIVKVTSAQVLIQETGSNTTFRKYKANVRKLR